jgi:dipeptidyl aminopeptidase/acylaminoacyl peptidase
MQKLLATALTATLATTALARPFTPQDMVSLSRVGAPVVSPDGRWLVWDQRETDLAANKGRHDLWRLDLKAKNGAPEKFASTDDPALAHREELERESHAFTIKSEDIDVAICGRRHLLLLA